MDLFSDEVRRDPYPLYERLRADSPVIHDPNTDLWLILDYAGVRRALADHEAFSSAVAPPGAMTSQWLVFCDPPRHAHLRALIAKAFTPRAIAAREPQVRALTCELLAPLARRDTFDLIDDFAVPLPLRVIAAMFGAPVADLPLYRRWSEVIMALGHAITGSAAAECVHREFLAVTAEMRAYLEPLAEARRRAPQDDLLTGLLAAEVDGERLKGDEVLGLFQLLLSAGHETTSNLIANAVVSLLERPTELARLRGAPELLPVAIEEFLRHRSPVQAMFRVTRVPVEMHGRTIPAGRWVLPMIGAANRDPAQFAEPDRLDITRDPNPHLAFGHGIHFCIGAPLSRLEARIALAELLARFTTLEHASDLPWQPRRAIHVLGPVHLPLRCATRA